MSDEQTIRASVQRQLAAGNRTTSVRAQVTLLQIIDTLRDELEKREAQIRRQGETIDRLRDTGVMREVER